MRVHLSATSFATKSALLAPNFKSSIDLNGSVRCLTTTLPSAFQCPLAQVMESGITGYIWTLQELLSA
jgi:hypothetical protein